MSAAPSRLNRWSRMKAESRAGARGMKFTLPGDDGEGAVEEAGLAPEGTAAEPMASDAILETQQEAASAAEEADSGETELPEIDDLHEDSDYTPFMSDKVSDAVRNMALRKLWRTNAVFANLDGLLDYGEDFTDAATVVANMQSVYKVGRGMVDYEAEEAAKAAEAEAAQQQATQQQAGELHAAEQGTLEESAGEDDTVHSELSDEQRAETSEPSAPETAEEPQIAAAEVEVDPLGTSKGVEDTGSEGQEVERGRPTRGGEVMQRPGQE